MLHTQDASKPVSSWPRTPEERDKKRDDYTECVSDIRCVGVFRVQRETLLKSVWTCRIKERLLFVMWRIRIKVQALVLPIPLYSWVQMWPFPILRSVKQALRERCEQWKDRFSVFMDRFRLNGRWRGLFFFFSLSVQRLNDGFVHSSWADLYHTVMLPQVIICSALAGEGIVCHMEAPVIHCLPASLMTEQLKASGLLSHTGHLQNRKVEWEPTAALLQSITQSPEIWTKTL